MNQKLDLLASSGSLDGIRKLISEYYGGATITLEPTGTSGIWDVHNALGCIRSVQVRKAGFRLRFERVYEAEVVE